MKIFVRMALVTTMIGLGSVAVLVVWIVALDVASGSLMSGGEEREYLLHVPSSYDAAQPTPLVISMHGAALWPASQRKMSKWNDVADLHGFIVVYPSGSGRPKIWNTFPEAVDRDIRFISDLIDTLSHTYSVDTTRIYANGLSNGGAMAFALSCGLPGKIAAVGTVAAAHSLSWDWCDKPAPMPFIGFHGTADPLVPYEGGESWASPTPFPSVLEWTERWASRNHCRSSFSQEQVASDVSRIAYLGCPEAPVVLYRIADGGHTWPGGEPLPRWLAGRTTQGIDASREMWRFFSRYSLSN